jgi:hypothetical protein
LLDQLLADPRRPVDVLGRACLLGRHLCLDLSPDEVGEGAVVRGLGRHRQCAELRGVDPHEPGGPTLE